MKKIILIDPEKCLACKSCELQCAQEHSQSKDLKQAIYEEPLPQARVKVASAAQLSTPLQCRHCKDAPCVQVCPSKATERPEEDGPVLIHEQLCIGCKWCTIVCPFGVIKMGRQGQAVTKCDLCFERLKKDEDPACVQGCPTGAIQFVSTEDLSSQKEQEQDYLIKFKKGKEII